MSTNKLILIPELAAEIGLNEALILHQIHYWCEKNKGDSIHYKEGRWWTFNTYKEWQEQFPFFSEHTIRRSIRSLENMGLLISSSFNKRGYDKTKWYTIEYDKLENILANCSVEASNLDIATGHFGRSEASILDSPIPENTTENTQREYSPPLVSDDKDDGRVGYGRYRWVRLSDEEALSLLTSYGEDAVFRAIAYVDTSAQQTDNRNGWRDWRLAVERAICENWGGIMNGIC